MRASLLALTVAIVIGLSVSPLSLGVGSARTAEKEPANRGAAEASEETGSKQSAETNRDSVEADEAKRKQDLGRLLLLWVFRHHPPQ
jgi:hypothetical protein